MFRLCAVTLWAPTRKSRTGLGIPAWPILTTEVPALPGRTQRTGAAGITLAVSVLSDPGADFDCAAKAKLLSGAMRID